MNNCKIYKVYSLQDNKYYIGSTKQDIHRRMLSHKSKNNNTNTKNIVGDLQYEILEEIDYPIEINDLRDIERSYIEKHEDEFGRICINKNIPNRSKKEYSVFYYNKNTEIIKEKSKIRYYKNHEKEKSVSREYYKKNRDKILERIKEKSYCKYCKLIINKATLNKHYKSKRHIDNLQHITIDTETV